MGIRETVADRITGGQLSEMQEVDHRRSQEMVLIRETLSRLEQIMYSDEWRRLDFEADTEFSREGIRRMTELSRLMRLKNPIIQRGVEVQRLYVWAQGINISAKDKDINQVIQDFLDDERNQAELTTHQARGDKERDLQQDGQIFLRFFVDRVTGRVRVRSIDPQEIDDVICNPEDKKEPWFYVRSYQKREMDGSVKEIKEAYPDWRYHPKNKLGNLPATALGARIVWETPVYHVKGNNPMGRWGLPEYYAAHAWALSYKNFLEQLASVWQALARWAAKITGIQSKTELANIKAKLNTTLDTSTEETNPPPTTGSLAFLGEGRDLQPFRTAGATMSAEDGRRLFLMAAQIFGFPETFYGDVSVGTLATAKSLDRPTELKILDRQELWADVHLNIFAFVLRWAVMAPQGPLSGMGKVEREPDGDEWMLRTEWNDGVDPSISADFPPVVEQDAAEQVGALADAMTLKGFALQGTIDLETATREFLNILGFSDIDAIMTEWKEVRDEEEETPEPPEPPDGNGQVPMTPDEMADMMGQTMEAVRRAMGKLEEAANGQ